MGNVVEFEVFRDHLGVAADDAAVDDVGKLYDAINAECRRLTGRQFEGDGGASYDQVIRIFGAREFNLPRVPVASITSITRHYYDGVEDPAFDATDYRLEDPDRGLVSLHPGLHHGRYGADVWPDSRSGRVMEPRSHIEYVHVVWVTTGEIPAQAIQAALEWGRDRWDSRARAGDLAGYSTGQDSETYNAALAGQPPRNAVRLLLAVSVATGGGVV